MKAARNFGKVALDASARLPLPSRGQFEGGSNGRHTGKSTKLSHRNMENQTFRPDSD